MRLIGFLDSLKAPEAAGALAYTDKLKAISLALMSVWEETLGYSEQAVKHINEAYDLASAFDAAPVNSAQGLLFVGDVEGTLVDSFVRNSFLSSRDRCYLSRKRDKISIIV